MFPASYLRSFTITTAIFVSISILFSVTSSLKFALSALVVPAHVLIVLTFFMGTLLTASVLRALWNTGKCITLLPIAFFSLALCQLYILNIIGWVLQIDAVSIHLLMYYLPQLFRRSFFSAPLLYYLVLTPSVVALPLLSIVIYQAAPALFRSISYLVDPVGFALFGKTRPATNATVSLFLYCGFSACLFWTAMDMVHLRGEPFSNLVRPIRPTAEQLPRSFYNPAKWAPGENFRYPVTRDLHRKNVVVVVADSLRADHLARFGYRRDTMPFLSRRLGKSSALTAEWATSACSISECGILAMLTSRPYSELNAGLFSLPEALHQAGYQTYFAVSGDFTKAFPGLYTLAAPHAELFTDGLADSRYGAYDDRVVLQALQRVPDYSDTPAFFYIHLHSVHMLGEKFQPPSYMPTGVDLWSMLTLGTKVAKPEGLGLFARLIGHVINSNFIGFAQKRKRLTNTYDNGIRQVDTVIEEILSALKHKGYLDHSVLVVTADHGEGLGEHGSWGHGTNLYAESIDIPMFILDTDFHASRTVPYATHLDIAPTIADLVKIPIPLQWRGRSLRTAVPQISTAQTTGPRPMKAVIWRTEGASYKYILDTLDGTEELFELRSDPYEQHNRISKFPTALLAFLRQTHTGVYLKIAEAE